MSQLDVEQVGDAVADLVQRHVGVGRDLDVRQQAAFDTASV
ncbi:MAG: hypothetical protein ACRDZ4_10230 [Egibacteraceae bacterium]